MTGMVRGGRPGRWAGLLPVLMVLAILCGCGGPGAGDAGEPEVEITLTVFAAASLTDAFGELAEVFEEENPDVEVRTSFAGSPTLAAQISQGAPADVFAPADAAQMEGVRNDGLLGTGPETFARNSLTIVVPADNPAGIRDYEDLARPGLRLVLAADGVPAAEYAEESLERAEDRYGGGFRRRVLENAASREADVRAAVNRVALGDADATFAYRSDLTPDVQDRVGTVEIPPEMNVTAEYPIAVLKNAPHPEPAGAWVNLVLSDEGQRVLEEWGFESAA